MKKRSNNMNEEKIQLLLQITDGLSKSEWERVVEVVNQNYSYQAAKVQLNSHDKELIGHWLKK
jgi:hypothetical protein